MSHTILLADDDAAIRMVLNQALTRAGYEVRPTGNLSTMWNWVSRGEGDLLITDVAMPDGNAFDVMPKIKKLRPELPIVVGGAGAFVVFVTVQESIERDRYPATVDKRLVVLHERHAHAFGDFFVGWFATVRGREVDRDDVEDMDEDALGELVEEHELEVDLDEHKTLRKKVRAVLDALEEAGLLED